MFIVQSKDQAKFLQQTQSHDQCIKNWVKILTAAVANLPVYMRVTPACNCVQSASHCMPLR